jgi:hypothetical protein
MKKVMYKIEEVIDLIKQNKNLLLAGDEELLKTLPDGNWIGGSIPYFMSENGGIISKDLIQVNEIPSFAEQIVCKSYDISSVKDIYKDGFDQGFSVVIIPASSETHLSFAINAPDYKEFASKPLLGWISGVHLDDLGKKTPKTFLGSGSSVNAKDAVAMHIKLPSSKFAEIGIVNIFTQGNGDTIEFSETGFQAKEAIINGQKQSFVEYLTKNNIDLRLPLVANYSGSMINISFQGINKESNLVDFYAPVFKGISYKQAAPVTNYLEQFSKEVQTSGVKDISFSCNCILNFLYSELEGKKTGSLTGPITFGEIAYQLLNQTMVTLEIHNL